MYKIELEQFQGPLDLLLRLIEGQELDISQVALGKVTDQYLEYLDRVENIETTELADFLVVATKLLVIKSKLLIPQAADDEDDSAEQLEAQLKLYRDYLDASKVLGDIISTKPFCFSRERVAVHFQPVFSPPKGLKASDLSDSFLEILSRIDYIVNLPEQIVHKVVSLTEKVTDIRTAIAQGQRTSFSSVMGKIESKGDAVV